MKFVELMYGRWSQCPLHWRSFLRMMKNEGVVKICEFRIHVTISPYDRARNVI
jgi:hypothetical protein